MPNDLRPAPPEVLDVVGELIGQYFPELATARIVIAVRDTPEDSGPGEDGQPQETVAATGVNDEPDAPFEYIVWFAWTVWEFLDDLQRHAMVFHELEHCGRDETGKPHLKPHDESVFTAEVELYGAWWKTAQEKLKELNARQAGKGTV